MKRSAEIPKLVPTCGSESARAGGGSELPLSGLPVSWSCPLGMSDFAPSPRHLSSCIRAQGTSSQSPEGGHDLGTRMIDPQAEAQISV